MFIVSSLSLYAIYSPQLNRVLTWISSDFENPWLWKKIIYIHTNLQFVDFRHFCDFFHSSYSCGDSSGTYFQLSWLFLHQTHLRCAVQQVLHWNESHLWLIDWFYWLVVLLLQAGSFCCPQTLGRLSDT